MRHVFRSWSLGAMLLGVPVVYAGLALPSQADVVRITVAPPPGRFERRPAPPSSHHVWAGGYWAWHGRRHEWVPGRWIEGRPGMVWVDSHWANEGGQWVFYEGHWVPGESPAMVTVAPPAPRVEVVPPEREWPRGHIWMRGHWEWHGDRHEWIPGRYEERREGHHWEEHRWEHGDDGRWRFHRGEWRHD